MRKKNKFFNFILIILILFGVSVGYAAINRTLNITGNSEVSKNTWDLHFENVRVTYGSVETDTSPIIDNNNLSVYFSFNLDLPGDFYEFTVDVLNKGTIDAMIDSISKTPELTDFQKKYLNYTIEYENGEAISSKQLLASYSLVRIKVRVEYRTDIAESDLPSVFETLNLGFTVNYVQGDISASKVNDNGVKNHVVAHGDINEFGTIVSIGTEKFYVIGTEGDNVKLFAMYNLYVGGSYNQSDDMWIEYEKATGMQKDTMLGYVSGENLSNGTTLFSNYANGSYYNNNYSNSIIVEYVNNYKNKLEDYFGVKVENATLISISELTSEEIGCKYRTDYDDYVCDKNEYQWVFDSSYWTRTEAGNYDFVWAICESGYLSRVHFNNSAIAGVRPVIEISKDEFETYDENTSFFIVEDVDGNNFKFRVPIDMTWIEFVNSISPDNLTEFKIYEDFIVLNGNNYRITDANSNHILKNEKIINNYKYYVKYVYVGGTADPE